MHHQVTFLSIIVTEPFITCCVVLVCMNPLDDSRLWFTAAAATLVAVSSQLSSADWRHPFVPGTLALVLAYTTALFFGDRPGVRAGAARGVGTAACLLSFQLLLLAVFVPDAAHLDELDTKLSNHQHYLAGCPLPAHIQYKHW